MIRRKGGTNSSQNANNGNGRPRGGYLPDKKAKDNLPPTKTSMTKIFRRRKLGTNKSFTAAARRRRRKEGDLVSDQ